MSFRLERDESPARGIRRIVRAQLERALQESAGAKEAKAAHAVRKRLKKIRAVLRLVKKELGPEVYREENQRLRQAARAFAGLRDADAQLELLEKMQKSECLAAESVAGVSQMLHTHRQEATSHGQEREEAITLLASLGDRLEGWPLDGLAVEALCCAFGKTYQKARKCFLYARDHRAPETLHSWRKHTKRVWYQARLLQQVHSPVICEVANGADTLGVYLGDLHDLAVLREQLGTAQSVPVAERELLAPLIRLRERTLEQTALDLGSRFYAERPGAFRRRLRRYARDWPEPPAPAA